jgi:hypothetical protein
MIIKIVCTEDGDKYFDVYTEADYLDSLHRDIKDGEDAPVFLMPNKDGEIDLDSAVGTILIRGEVITPTPVKTTTRWKL